MNQGQVGGLLANRHQYLIHMCITGLKGKRYEPIIDWFSLIYSYTSKLVSLLKQEGSQMGLCLDVVKCGLFSRNADVANACAKVLTRVAQEIQTSEDAELREALLLWLTETRDISSRRN